MPDLKVGDKVSVTRKGLQVYETLQIQSINGPKVRVQSAVGEITCILEAKESEINKGPIYFVEFRKANNGVPSYVFYKDEIRKVVKISFEDLDEEDKF